MSTTRTVQNKEQEILAAAEHEFLEKGFSGARTTAIAEAAGVSHAMLHYYFRTKEAIFDRILDEKVRLMGESVLAVFGDRNLPLQERLQEGMMRHFDFIAANPNLPRFIVIEIFSKPERYEAMQQRLQPLLFGLVDSLQQDIDKEADRGTIEWVDVRQLMLDILSLNIFPFLSYNIIKPMLGGDMADMDTFLEARRRENVETIRRRLKRS